MTVAPRLESLLRKTWSQLFPLRGKTGNMIPLPELLAQMDAYDWDSVDDMSVNEDRRGEKLRHLNEVITASGVELNSTILDLASGITSIAYLYPNTVAVDNDPQKIKMLRRDGIKAVIADIENLPFENKSFDYVVSISTPQKPIIVHSNGYVSFGVDYEYNKKVVEAALRIAREKVLFASYYIFLRPPYEHLIEKRDIVNGFYTDYYVVYRANNNPAEVAV